MTNLEDAKKFLIWGNADDLTDEEIDVALSHCSEEQIDEYAELWTAVAGTHENMVAHREEHSLTDIVSYAARWAAEGSDEGRDQEYFETVFHSILEQTILQLMQHAVEEDRKDREGL